MKYLPFKTLFKEAFLSIFIPHKTFSRIPKNPRLNYRRLIITLFFLGFVGQAAQLPTIHGTFFFHPQRFDLLLVVLVPFFSVGLWALGSLFFYYLGRLLSKNTSLKRIEIATFYLWFIWLVMPVFDFIHLLLGTHFIMAAFWGIDIHLSWFFAIPALICETFFLLKNLVGLRGKQIFFIAILAPIIDRFVIGNIPIVAGKLLSTNFPHLDTIDYFLFITPPASVCIFFIWLIHKKKYTALSVIVQTFMSCLLVFSSSLILATRVVPPPVSTPPGANAAPLGGQSKFTHSYTFQSPDVTGGSGVTDTASSQPTWFSNTYTGITFDFTPANETIVDIPIPVTVTAATNHTGTMKMQGCFYSTAATNNYYCSAWQTINATGTFTFTISSSSIYSYSAGTNGNSSDGLGSADTSSDWDTLVSNMATSGNQIIIHVFTDFASGAYGGNDSLTFTPAYLEVDYRTTLSQADYYWFQNEDSYTPTVAHETGGSNTPATNVHRNEVVRLRVDLGSYTAGDLTASDETFKLQYAKMVGANCAGGDETWTDVGAPSSTTAVWRGYDNSTPTDLTDGNTLPSNIIGDTPESYEEQNNSASNPNAIVHTAAGEWDWVIQNYLADLYTAYCFQMVAATSVNNVQLYNSTYGAKLTTADDIINLQGQVNLQGQINLQ